VDVGQRAAAEGRAAVERRDLGRELVHRRVTALAYLTPVLELERHKNAGGRDWRCYDMRLLAVTAVDTAASGAGLAGEGGVPREDVLAAVTDEARRCAPERPHREHRQAATFVIDALLNQTSNDASHEVEIVDVTDGYQRRMLTVRLLFETLAGDGQTVLVNVDPAAVHLLIVALDRDLEAAQVAFDEVIRFQMRTGRLDDATTSAQQALLLSRRYRDSIREHLRSLRQNLHTVDWDDVVEPTLARALEHVEGRVAAETVLREHARQARVGDDPAEDGSDQATAQVRQRASELYQLMQSCLATLTDLQGDLLGAREQFRAEQARQAFAPPAPIGTVDLVEEVLGPLLAGSAAEGTQRAELLMVAFAGTAMPELFELESFLDALTRSPAEPPDTLDDDPAVVLDPLEELISRFGDEHFDTVDELLAAHAINGPVRLSELVAAAEGHAAGNDTYAYELSLLMTLTALRAFTPQVTGDETAGALLATADGTTMSSRAVRDAPDLLVRTAARSLESPSTSDQEELL
jgi:hypothetical protein